MKGGHRGLSLLLVISGERPLANSFCMDMGYRWEVTGSYHSGTPGEGKIRGNGNRMDRDKIMRHFREIFDDRWTKTAGVIFILIIAVLVFNLFSDFTQAHPLIAILIFSLVPVLFIVGGIVFVVDIIRIFVQRRDT